MLLPGDTSGCAGGTGCVRFIVAAGGYDPPLRYPCTPKAYRAEGISCRKAYRESRRDFYRILVGEDRIFPFRCCGGQIRSAPTVSLRAEGTYRAEGISCRKAYRAPRGQIWRLTPRDNPPFHPPFTQGGQEGKCAVGASLVQREVAREARRRDCTAHSFFRLKKTPVCDIILY